ncbi:2-hydroxychromene-2-carboxylate isomerase [Qipengyuania sp. 6B39]|uniref:2-hydroxychromene-2-carboxylate isomerase n=1 Tax=Qipengyuania proteolytica TaxID=2867239 RepID=UPI001C89A9D6|nr:2-hydroxychromene-2-carboxylate isomerase [Qipengyuania proteolytica]MBX7495469.1 2-hydroxychromene-2-carboxylate isomerase [Qipengyuania proteolytica]
MTVPIEFFFDLSSPWTRLAFANVRPALDGLDYTIRWRPLLVGGVFNAVNPAVYESRKPENAARLARSFGWLKQWAELAGVGMNFPTEHHPLKSVHAMRCCCALEDDQPALERFAAAAFEAYFTDGRNLDDPAELVTVAGEAGFDGAALAAAAASQPVKDRLRANTDEAIARGAFGSPTFFVAGEHMYFGNDQLPLVRQKVALLA